MPEEKSMKFTNIYTIYELLHDFKQCGIYDSVDSDKPVQLLF